MRVAVAILFAGVVVALAHSVAVVWTLEDEHQSIVEQPDGSVVTSTVPARVTFWIERPGQCRIGNGVVELPVGYSAADLSNAVAKGAAQLAEAHKLQDWTPQQLVVP